jgi:hypothetical protein
MNTIRAGELPVTWPAAQVFTMSPHTEGHHTPDGSCSMLTASVARPHPGVHKEWRLTPGGLLYPSCREKIGATSDRYWSKRDEALRVSDRTGVGQ